MQDSKAPISNARVRKVFVQAGASMRHSICASSCIDLMPPVGSSLFETVDYILCGVDGEFIEMVVCFKEAKSYTPPYSKELLTLDELIPNALYKDCDLPCLYTFDDMMDVLVQLGMITR